MQTDYRIASPDGYHNSANEKEGKNMPGLFRKFAGEPLLASMVLGYLITAQALRVTLQRTDSLDNRFPVM